MGVSSARLLLQAGLLLAVTASQAPTPWQPSAFPHPKTEFKACGRAVPGNICDPDGVLSDKSKDYVAGVAQAIWEGSKPYALADCAGKPAGYQVAVAVMQRMEVPPGSTPAQAAHDFAKALHASWGVGDAACENGVVLLLSVGDRLVYISTGKGAKRTLSSERIDDVIADMRPALRRADYDGAVERAVVDIGLALAGGKPAGEPVDWFGVGFFALLAAIVGGNGLKAWRRKREYAACRRALAKIKREQEQLRSRAWSCPQSCPICLEDFTTPHAPGRPGDDDDNGKGDKSRAREQASGSQGYGGGGSGVDAEAGPSTSLLHSTSASSEEEFARMSAAGQAAVRRLRLRRRGSAGAGGASGASGSGWADGAGPSTAAASGADGEEARQERVPITLLCGHTFCTACLDQWLDKGVTCPVCRKPISDEGSPRPDNGDGGPSGLRGQQARLADDWLATDLAFRLGVLQTRYPLYITPTMVDDWRSEAQATGSFSWEASRDFQLADPGARQHYESMGGGGFSAGFGGGTGFGGGGGGGGW